jgi:hemoglobin
MTLKSTCALQKGDFPDAPFPPNDVYHKVGEQAIRQLIRTQHELMWQSDIAVLFGQRSHFERVVTYTEDYFIEMLGGPKLFTAQRGEPKLGRRHKPFNLTPHHREVWLACLEKAIVKCQFQTDSVQHLWRWVEPLSMRFLTPRLHPNQLKRILFMDGTNTKTDTTKSETT